MSLEYYKGESSPIMWKKLFKKKKKKKKTILHGFSDKKRIKFHSTIPEGKQIFWKICYWQDHWVPVGSLM